MTMQERCLVYITILYVLSLLAVHFTYISRQDRYVRILPNNPGDLHAFVQASKATGLVNSDTTTANGKESNLSIRHECADAYSLEQHKLKAHPHMGALDENGCPGYIHDTTYIRLHPLNFTFFPPEGKGEGICDTLFGDGPEGRSGVRALRKIRVASPPSLSTPPPSVLCIVYTHSNRHEILRSIVETWGQRCDGFLAASNQTDKTLGSVNIPHMGPESYKSMWQKVRSTWAYVHDHYLDQFSWFHIGGDDMFVIAENLRYGLQHYPAEHDPMYVGGAMVRFPQTRKRYCGGGSGYTLNRAALRILVQQRFDRPDCKPNDIRPDEDVIISDCLRPIVNCTHSVDERDETRYHPFTAQYHSLWKHPSPANWFPEILLHQGITATMKPYMESISETTVSFHLVLKTELSRYDSPKTVFADKGMRRYHAILFNLCGFKSRREQRQQVRNKVPRTG